MSSYLLHTYLAKVRTDPKEIFHSVRAGLVFYKDLPSSCKECTIGAAKRADGDT